MTAKSKTEHTHRVRTGTLNDVKNPISQLNSIFDFVAAAKM